jgi:asparagine synthase (glutamine-hydrolysing)
MCGIVCLFGEQRDVPHNILSHRGPDAHATKTLGRCRIDFHRLAINDLTDAGMQPFTYEDVMFACNGEIYNHKELSMGYEKSQSDCECLGSYIKLFGIQHALEEIRGDFALVYTDGKHIIAARDPVGVRPLFYTRYSKDSIAFASEAKALLFLNTQIHVFPPGTFYDSHINQFVSYYTGYWHVKTKVSTQNILKETLEDAVRVRLENTQRDVGFLLSGGLDSSLIASIAQRCVGKIKTFSIGLEGSPDLEAASKVAKFIGSDHHEVVFTVKEGMDAVVHVIAALETYDTTTVRASVPMYLLCKYIKEHTTCRYIFSGEGSDELLGGYLYFKNAPGVHEFAMENMRRLKLIHQFDGLRADRCAGAHGLDLVVPFLDTRFINACMEMNQNEKMGPCEKRVLRDAFIGYLPEEILWRQKDGMSDAVGAQWVDALRAKGEDVISDTAFMVNRAVCGEHNAPLTKEEVWYREIFWKFFGCRHDHLISEIWRPRWTDVTDPSARLLIKSS